MSAESLKKPILDISRHDLRLVQVVSTVVILAISGVALGILATHGYNFQAMLAVTTQKGFMIMSSAAGISLALMVISSLLLCRKNVSTPVSKSSKKDTVEKPSKKVKKLRSPEVDRKKAILRKKARDRLGKAQNYRHTVDWQQFALMNNAPSFIKFSAYDGGHYESFCYKAHRSYLDHLKKGGAYLTLPKREHLFHEMDETLAAMGTIGEACPPYMIGVRYKFEIEYWANRVLELINNNLNSKKAVAYLPSGWCGNQHSYGHAMGLKIKKTDKITIQFANLGDGAQIHPPLEATSTHLKVSYSYYPVHLTFEAWEKWGLTILSHLLRYKFEVTEKPFSSKGQELYDLLHTIGEVDPSFIANNAEKFKAKLQEVGDCAEKGVSNLMKDDLLTEKNLSCEEVDVTFLNIHLASIVEGYHAYKERPTNDHQKLLKNAVEELGTRILNAKELLNELEYLLTLEMLDLILEELKKPLPSPPQLKAPPMKSQPVETVFPAISPPKRESFTIKNEDVREVGVLMDSFAFNPLTFKQQLKTWVDNIQKNVKGEMSLYHLVMSLPVPTPAKDQNPWSQIPLDDVQEILLTLQKLPPLVGAGGSQDNCEKSKRVVILSFLYAVADSLARLNKKTQLEGFASPFHWVKEEPFLIFHSMQDEKRYLQIKTYFLEMQKACKQKIIFPVSQTLPIKTFALDVESDQKTQGAEHILFLLQFLSTSSKLQNLMGDEIDYTALWISKEIPQEVHCLYYFAIISDPIFSSTALARKFQGDGVSRLPSDFSFIQGPMGSLGINEGRDYSPDWENQWNDQKYNVTAHAPSLTVNDIVSGSERYKAAITASQYKVSPEAAREQEEWNRKRTQEQAWEHAELPEEKRDSLMPLFSHRNLMVGLGIEWVREHFQDINYSAVQSQLERCFFSFGVLRERLTAVPETSEELRSVVEEGLTYFSESPLKNIRAILFLIRLGVCFESYSASILNKPIDEALLNHYRKKVEELPPLLEGDQCELERSIHTVLIYIDTFRKMRTKEDFLETYTSIFRMGLYATAGSGYLRAIGSLYSTTNFYLHIHAKRLNEFFTNYRLQANVVKNDFCNALLSRLGKMPDDRKWQEKAFLEFSDKNWVMNLVEGRISNGGNPLTPIFKEERARMPGVEIDPKSLWWIARQGDNRQVFISFDEEVTLIFHYGEKGKEKTHIFKMGEHVKQEVVRFDDVAEGAFYFLKPQEKVHRCYQIVKEDENAKEFHVLDIRFNNRKTSESVSRPYALIHIHPNGVDVTRVDKEGKPLPYKLANLKDLAKEHPLYQYTCKFAPHDKIHCFVDHVGEIEELTFVELDLKFKRKGKRLESVEFPGFFFMPLMHIEALGEPSKEALILRNVHGQMKVLLFPPQKEERVLGEADKKYIEAFSGHRQDACFYFVYEVTPSKDEILAQSLSSALFLSYVLKSKGDLTKAWLILKNFKGHLHFDADIGRVLYLFFSQVDSTPQSIGFNVRLLLFVVDHFHTLAVNENDRNTLYYFLSKAAQTWFVDYLKTKGEDRFSSIPRRFHLSEAEESRILTLLTSEGIPLTKMLSIRDELLHTDARSAHVKFLPQDVRVAPSLFNSITPPDELASLKLKGDFPFGKNPEWQKQELLPFQAYPNQLSAAYLIRHFTTLYDEARKASKAKDPFDFTLLALLRVGDLPDKFEMDGKTYQPKYREMRKLAHLLFYVRHFSSHFKYLSLDTSSGVVQANKILIFNRIVDKCCLLKKTKEYPDFEENVLKRTVRFEFTEESHLSLPDCVAPIVPLDPSKTLKIDKKPFGLHQKRLFKAEKRPSSFKQKELFADNPNVKVSTLEKGLREKFNKAYKTLKESQETTFSLERPSLAPVYESLQMQREEISQEVERLEKLIETQANHPFEAFQMDCSFLDEREFRYELNANQKSHITPEMLMCEVILKNDRSFLSKERPMIDKESTVVLLDNVHRYTHLKVLLTILEKGALHAKKLMKGKDIVSEKALLTILNYEFLYDPVLNPEISYFIVKTGKLLRPNQVMIHLWVCEGLEKNENRLFQLGAGEGKTSVLTPLFILRCERLGLVPAVITTAPMITIEKANLSQSLKLVGKRLDTLEIDMHSRLNLLQIKAIYQKLKGFARDRKAFIVTPQAYYALRLMYFSASLHSDEKEKALVLEKMLAFWQKNVLQIVDESHRNFDPLTQAIFGIGDFVSLSKIEFNHLFEMMRPLLGTFETGYFKKEELERLSILSRPLQGIPKADELKWIQKMLAHYSTYLLLKEFPRDDRASFIPFLTQKEALEPAKFKGLKPDVQQMLLLTRYFLVELLPFMTSLRTDFDHMAAPDQGEIDAPAHHRMPSKAQFKDPYLTCVLSIKGSYARGLDESQVMNVIKKLKENDEIEQSVHSSVLTTPSQRLFKKWVESRFPKLNLREVLFGQPSIDLMDHLKKNPGVIEFYLYHTMRHNMGYSKEQFTSSPAHMMNGSKCNVTFSATPLPRLAYPRALQGVRTDDLFEARVVAQAKMKENQNFLFPKTSDAFFAHMKAKKQQFANKRVMIDAGGFLCDYKNKQVAKKWLEATNLLGVLYFDDEKANKLCLLIKEGEKIITFKGGTDSYKEELQALGIHIDPKRLGTYFDGATAESANIPQELYTMAIIFAGESLTISHAIQAIMRMRGFLDDYMHQTILWVVQGDLKSKMNPTKSPFTADHLFEWSLKNEAKRKENALILAAFQEISLKIEKLRLKGSQDQIALIKKHASAFKEKVNPSQMWGAREVLDGTDKVLWAYARGYYACFKFTIAFDRNLALQAELQPIIEETVSQVPQIAVDYSQKAFKETHHRCVVEKEVIQVQYKPKTVEIFPEKLKKALSLLDKDYPKRRDRESSRAVFKTPHLTDGLYFEHNQIHTACTRTEPLKERFLKPIDFLMIVIHDNKVWAEAISNDVLTDYLREMQKCQSEDLTHQVFVIKANGKLYQKGRGRLAPDKTKMEYILGSKWLKDVLVDVALFKVKIFDKERLQQRLKKWPDFKEFGKQVLEAFPSKSSASPAFFAETERRLVF